VVRRPRLARRLLVVTDGEHHHVGLCGHGGRLADAAAILLRVGRRHLVLLPGPADGDLAALVIEDLDIGRRPHADALEDGVDVDRLAAVAAEHHAVGVRSDDGDAAHPVLVERQDTAFVLQQRDGLPRRLERQGAMERVVYDPLGLVRVDVRIVEQPQEELRAQHRPHALVDERLRNDAVPHEIDQMGVTVGVGQLDVDAGADGQFGGVPAVAAT